MSIPSILIRLAPVALRVAKTIIVIAPHVIAAYQHRKETKLFEGGKKLK